MAEENQDKFSLPLAGVATLLALAGAVFFYQSPLKTSRPIDQEAEKKVASHTRVQSRLWQDPFEAVETHRLQKREHHNLEKAYGENSPDFRSTSFEDLIENIKAAGGLSRFRILPVFVDGSPYANGMESRLKDRYAVVSALGAAGYMPESGEYIRYFSWPYSLSGSKTKTNMIIPVERFLPDANTRMLWNEPDVLILWLKDQDFGDGKPLELMNKLIGHLKTELGEAEIKSLSTNNLPNLPDSPTMTLWLRSPGKWRNVWQAGRYRMSFGLVWNR